MSFYDAIRVGAAGASTGYEVERSLRFVKASSNQSSRLERTPSSTGNQKVWTWSCWFKRTKLADSSYFITSYGNNDGIAAIYFDNSDRINTYFDTSGSNPYGAVNERRYRDLSAWMHMVWQVDAVNTTQRIWINGVEESLDSGLNPPNFAYTMNQSGQQNTVGGAAWYPTGTGSNMYLAEAHFSDGNKYTPSDFTETDATTGQLIPKEVDITYGTNGFYLNFSDNSGTTATTLGKDYSGNSNNWTPTNFSVAAGLGNDSMVDTPTNNFPTFNPLDKSSDIVLYEGNLRYSFASRPNSRTVRATFALPSNGKYYWEFLNEQASSNPGRISMGVVDITVAGQTHNTNPNSNGYIMYSYGGGININGSSIGTAGSWYNTERAAIAVDCDTGKFWFGKVASGGTTTWYNSSTGTDGNPATGDNPTTTLTTPSNFMPFGGWHEGGSGSEFFSAAINFGQQPFLGTEPTGYKKLSSANLPNPTIKLPNKHFDTKLWTGNGGTQTISGLSFAPDWVWIKIRTQAYNHQLIDTVRGATLRLQSNATTEEKTNTNGLSAFTSDGYTLGDQNNVNKSSDTFVGWNWNAGDTDSKTYTVTVVSDSGNKYRFDGFGTSAVTLDLAEGGTYIFNMDNATNATHPFSIGTAANGTVYTSGITYFLDGVSKTYSQYTSGFAAASTRRLHITVPASAPVLYYWCSAHSGMGGQINTNSTLGSSNFDGSVQATVKANATAGFSIIIAEAPSASTNFTVGHGLGVAPNVIFSKSRESAQYWAVYHDKTTNTIRKYLKLDDTLATTTSGGDMWGSAFPTSSVIGLSSANAMVANQDFVCYCFSEVTGYSKFGSYTGNGSTDGPFVFTNFRPSVIIFKRTDSSNNWNIYDAKRDIDNQCRLNIRPNTSDAEYDETEGIDFLSNGFKLRESAAYANANGGTYIYLAFAESPFKNSRAR